MNLDKLIGIHMRHTKSAVFQINDSCSAVRLICVRGATFADGARLETALRDSYGTCFYVTFLGRFDQIETVANVVEFLDLALQPLDMTCGATRGQLPLPIRLRYEFRF
jgi:hypothetical protein